MLLLLLLYEQFGCGRRKLSDSLSASRSLSAPAAVVAVVVGQAALRH